MAKKINWKKVLEGCVVFAMMAYGAAIAIEGFKWFSKKKKSDFFLEENEAQTMKDVEKDEKDE